MRSAGKVSSSFMVLAGVIALVGCGGESPLAPSASSSSQGVVLRGTLMGGASGSAAGILSTTGTITVTVQENPAITTTVGPDGSFTLRGLPEGGFTLDFTEDGTPLGTLTFDEVKPNQEITITVDTSGGTVVLVEEKRDGIGHGDLEIEGFVDAVLVLNPDGESRFTIDGYTVVHQPGQTAIRQGNRLRGVDDLTVGTKVHVKGVWLEPEGSTQPVLAHEIIIQDNDDDDGDDDDDGGACMINGGRVGDRIELEGNIQSGSATSFMLKVKGNRASGPVEIDASAASFECSPKSGPNAPSPSECQAKVKAGAQVHVRGTLESCSTSSALVDASVVMVQKE